jgi:putative transposon-encoded protein
MPKNPNEEENTTETSTEGENIPHRMTKFEVFGEEMLEKSVKLSGNSGRIYLPPDWVGHRVKVIRID